MEHPPHDSLPPDPERKHTPAWIPAVVGAAVGIIVLAVIGVVVYGPSLLKGSSTLVEQEDGSTHVRQADGGRFATPQEFIQAMHSAGIECIDEWYGRNKKNQLFGQCWSGSGTVSIAIIGENATLYEHEIRSLKPIVRGKNWLFMANEDPSMAIAVKNGLGGNVFQ